MLTWLKRKLREWLLTEEERSPKPYLDCSVNGKHVIFRITGTHGFLLWGTSKDGTRLVGEGMACDVDHYRRLWKHLNKGNVFTWEELPGDKGYESDKKKGISSK